MKRSRNRRTGAQAIAISPRQFFGRFTLVLMVLTSFALIIMSRAAPETRAAIAAPIADSAAPALDVLSRPVIAFQNVQDWFAQFADIYTQNAELREANRHLMQWQHVALQLEAENNALRELLNYSADEQLRFTTAKIISDRGGPFSRTVMINAGSALGLSTGLPIINGDGLIGHIIETGQHSARVLLLTDINSRIPVITSDSRERAIAAGSNSEHLTLLYLPDDSKVAVGERIVTSGDGKTVPAGLPVGEVIAVEDGVVSIRPYASRQRIEYVSAIHREDTLPTP